MQICVYEPRYITVKKEARERISKAERENLCVGCMQPLDAGRTIRGCHERCYRATTRAIERGDYTESQRVASGKLLERDPGGRPPSNPISIEAAS